MNAYATATARALLAKQARLAGPAATTLAPVRWLPSVARVGRFALHFLEMVVVMMVGMAPYMAFVKAPPVAYAASFARSGLLVGQVLLTADDLVRRAHYRNANRTLERLLSLGVVPVVNENDAVATEEIRFGDNDRLAALVAHLVAAEALVLLSEVDGLYDGDPRRPGARLIPEVRGGDDLAGVRIGRAGASGVGTGGMASKLDAARIASGAGVPVLLAAAEQVAAALAGRQVGTAFPATARRTASRLFWLRHATTPRGQLVLDAGAVDAVVRRRTSLLSAGVTGVRGEFGAGDPVELLGPDGVAVARGLVGYDAAELPELLGRSTRELDPEHRREVVHRDDLVLLRG